MLLATVARRKGTLDRGFSLSPHHLDQGPTSEDLQHAFHIVGQDKEPAALAHTVGIVPPSMT
jgi:hypothetical protein